MLTTATALHCDDDGAVFALSSAAPCRIGRENINDIVLADGSASRFHAIVQLDRGGACSIVDLGSANGTTVDGRRVTAPTPLANGNLIVLGGRRLVFRQTAPEAAPNPPPLPERTTFLLMRGLVTVLVIDIRGSIALASALGDERFAKLMSDFFRIAGKLLDAQGCWAQKFIGDAVMGVWRETGSVVDTARFAAMLGLIDDFVHLASTVSASHELSNPLRFGVGLHSGYASTGNMGSNGSADFTAMGDTVSKTFRLESGTRQLACDAVISQEFIRLVDPPVVADLDTAAVRVTLKGFDSPEPIYPFQFADLTRLAGVLESRG